MSVSLWEVANDVPRSFPLVLGKPGRHAAFQDSPALRTPGNGKWRFPEPHSSARPPPLEAPLLGSPHSSVLPPPFLPGEQKGVRSRSPPAPRRPLQRDRSGRLEFAGTPGAAGPPRSRSRSRSPSARLQLNGPAAAPRLAAPQLLPARPLRHDAGAQRGSRSRRAWSSRGLSAEPRRARDPGRGAS